MLQISKQQDGGAMAVRFKHVYIIQKEEKDDSNTYIATLPALPNVGGVSDTTEGAISALRAALISVLQEIAEDGGDESELPDSLEHEGIVGFGVLEASSDDELPEEDDLEE